MNFQPSSPGHLGHGVGNLLDPHVVGHPAVIELHGRIDDQRKTRSGFCSGSGKLNDGTGRESAGACCRLLRPVPALHDRVLPEGVE